MSSLHEIDETIRAEGTHLDLESYVKVFTRSLESSTLFLKTESAQEFQEPGNKSLEAYKAHDFRRSAQLIADMDVHQSRVAELARAGSLRAQRLRRVQLPLSDYLTWELGILWRRHAAGQEVRIPRERDVGLGELVILSAETFAVDYSSDGEPVGAYHLDHYGAREVEQAWERSWANAVPLPDFIGEHTLDFHVLVSKLSDDLPTLG